MEEFTGLDAEDKQGDTLDNFDSLELREMSFTYPGIIELAE